MIPIALVLRAMVVIALWLDAAVPGRVSRNRYRTVFKVKHAGPRLKL